MREKQSRMRQRRQQFRSRFGGKKAVSPVVATLILILIAVAAAAALYLWLVVWQGNITGGIGSPHAQATLTIGGSTSAFPFTSLGASWFEQNQSDVAVSDNQGGTGAGMIAVCEGNIQLGAASIPMSVTLLENNYGCAPQYAATTVITTIAYDAVDVASAGTAAHGLLSVSADTVNFVYEADSSSAPSCVTGSQPDCLGTENGVAIPTAYIQDTGGTGATGWVALEWEDIPAIAIVPGTSTISFTGAAGTAGLSDNAADAGGVTTTSSNFEVCNVGTSASTTQPDLCDVGLLGGKTATGTPCGFAVCAGGSGSTATATSAIVPVERSDASGTTQTFESRLLGYGTITGTSSSSWGGSGASAIPQTLSTAFANLGYNGCGGNNLLSDCGFTYPAAQAGLGNPGVGAILVGHPNDIGYMSDGIVRTYSGLGASAIVPFLGLGQGVNGAGLPNTVTVSPWDSSSSFYYYGGVLPTTGTTGSIAAGLTGSGTINQYVGGRPFQLVSLEPLTGTAQEYVTFITDPQVNAALALATDEVGLYQVV